MTNKCQGWDKVFFENILPQKIYHMLRKEIYHTTSKQFTTLH